MVKQAIGSSSNNVGTLCTHNSINKWSKHKPINFTKSAGLTEDEFRGMDSDNAIGIFYGLKAVSVVGDIGQLHNADYSYYRPKGGAISPYRLGDFRGYDHFAVPTLNLSYITNIVYYNDRPSLTCSVTYDYQGKNTTGVDINDFLPTGDSKNIGDYYLCVLVDNYAIALYNTALSSSTNKVFTPLKYNGVWQGVFGCDFDISALQQVNNNRKVTTFLIRSIDNVNWDLREWQNTNLVGGTERGISIPMGINLSIPIQYRTNIAKVDIGGVTYNNNTISVSWSIMEAIQATKFKVAVVIKDSIGMLIWGGNVDVTKSQSDSIGQIILTVVGTNVNITSSYPIIAYVTISQYMTNSDTLYTENTKATINI